MLSGLKEKFFAFSLVILRLAIILFLFTLLFRLTEFAVLSFRSLLPRGAWLNFLMGIAGDVAAICYYSVVLFLPFFLVFLFAGTASRLLVIGVFTLLILIQLLLTIYFLISGILLDDAFYNYTYADIKYIIVATGISLTIVFIGIFTVFFGIYFLLRKFTLIVIYPGKSHRVFLPIAILITAFHQNIIHLPINGDFGLSMQANKSFYFLNRTTRYFRKIKTRIKPEDLKREIALFQTWHGDTNYVSTTYPLLRKNNYPDVLSPFFKFDSSAKPNFVFIIVEGLAKTFSGKNAINGSFTPFLDSLAEHSLYFPNVLSTSERTLCVLPSLLGSLPYGRGGFTKLIEDGKYPRHFSFLKILEENNYYTAFHYGGWSHFTNYDDFLFEQGIDYISNEKAKATAFEWGLSDEEVYKSSLNLLESLKTPTPRVDIYLTLSTHHPFRIPRGEYYKNLFLEKLKNSSIEQSGKTELKTCIDNYASVLYADDAIRNFFTQYRKRPEYNNTIFIITGDHVMPEIPLQNRNINRYHVPLIVYSPLLKSAQIFPAVSSHLDLVPSLITLLQKNFNINVPEKVHWLGEGLDTSSTYRNIHSLAFMYNNTEIDDFISGDYFLSGRTIYNVSASLENPSEVHDANVIDEFEKRLQNFRNINSYVCLNDKILDAQDEKNFENHVEKIELPINSSFEFNVKDSVSILNKFELKKKLRRFTIQYSFNYNPSNPSVNPSVFCMSITSKDGKVINYKEQEFNDAPQFKISKYDIPVAGFCNFDLHAPNSEEIFLNIWFRNSSAISGGINHMIIKAKRN
jgi:phosphoglycerol transferase MdoB-like AlkP superfamily enzyme